MSTRISFLLLFALCPFYAFAEDFVIMKNGDRITGEINKIWNEELFIEPEYCDEYAIEMKYISYVHTDEEFEIAFRRGRRTHTVTGRLDLGEEGKPMVLASDGTSYPLSEVDNMEEIEEFFEWSVRGDLSANVSRGNTDTTQARLYSRAEIKLGEHRHSLELTRDEQQSVGETIKEQTDVRYVDTWTFMEDWFVRAGLSWTRDPIRDLDSRSQLYIGPGYHLWDDSKRQLNFSIGPSYIVEDINGVEDESHAVGFMLRYEQKFFHDDLVLFHNSIFTTIYRGRENDVFDTSTGFRYDITDDIYFNLQVDYDYETNPSSEALNEDVTYLMGIGVELD